MPATFREISDLVYCRYSISRFIFFIFRVGRLKEIDLEKECHAPGVFRDSSILKNIVKLKTQQQKHKIPHCLSPLVHSSGLILSMFMIEYAVFYLLSLQILIIEFILLHVL